MQVLFATPFINQEIFLTYITHDFASTTPWAAALLLPHFQLNVEKDLREKEIEELKEGGRGRLCVSTPPRLPSCATGFVL